MVGLIDATLKGHKMFVREKRKHRKGRK